MKPAAIDREGVRYQDAQGHEALLPSDWVVVALGSQPSDEPVERLKATGAQVIPLPYCESPQAAYRASLEGAAAAREL